MLRRHAWGCLTCRTPLEVLQQEAEAALLALRWGGAQGNDQGEGQTQ